MSICILKTIKDFNKWEKTINGGINFVPTMGNLHKGHLKLIEYAAQLKNNPTLVSIFINPLQFDNKKDLLNYPKSFKKDIEKASLAGADAVFLPDKEEIFPTNNKEVVYLKASKELSGSLCGVKRLGHFDGVCTVVYRLLKIIKPKSMFLGEKDWQQLLILKEMISRMNLDIVINSVQTVREPEGFPYSSRNSLLSLEEREKLKLFSSVLYSAKKNFPKECFINTNEISNKLEKNNIHVEYLKHVNPYSLKNCSSSDNITMLAGAIKCGNTRLIDHIFLMKRNPIIAIDGPAGSGKSTITKLIAKELKLLYLDTGAMYRGLTWLLINENIDWHNTKKLNQFLKTVFIVFKSRNDSEQELLINNHSLKDQIRSKEITSQVSGISSINEIRKFLVSEQKKIGEKGGLVAEGRDIGTAVFPNADLKIFLTASIDERAKRRKLELELKGKKKIDFVEIKNEIKKRDLQDSTRKISPLKKAKDAYEINTDGLTINEVCEKIINLFNTKIPKELEI